MKPTPFLHSLYLIACFLPCVYLHAAEKPNYIDVLRYGTDMEIQKAFSMVSTDLGEEVNTAVPGIFEEKHAVSVYAAMVAYIGAARLNEADILIRELDRAGAGIDYREAIVRALGELKATEAIDDLKALYSDKRTTGRLKASVIDAWGAIGDPSVEDTLLSIVKDIREEEEVRARALLALGLVGTQKSLDMLKKIAMNVHERKLLRMYAVDSMGKIGQIQVIEELGELIYDGQHEVAEYAAYGIARINREECVPYLLTALRSDYDKVRYIGVQGLVKLKSEEAVRILEYRMRYDMNEKVREEAGKCLALIEGEADGSITAGGEINEETDEIEEDRTSDVMTEDKVVENDSSLGEDNETIADDQEDELIE